MNGRGVFTVHGPGVRFTMIAMMIAPIPIRPMRVMRLEPRR